MKSGLTSTTVLSSIRPIMGGDFGWGDLRTCVFGGGQTGLEVHGPQGTPLKNVFARTGDRNGTHLAGRF